MRTFRLGNVVLGLAVALAMTTAALGQVNPPVASNIPPPFAKQPSVFGGSFELFAGGSMEFARATQANGKAISTTNVGGFQTGLRYHLTDNHAFEFRYSWAEPLQTYGTNLFVKSRENTFSIDYVYTFLSDHRIRPYLLAGYSIIHYVAILPQSSPGAFNQIRPGYDYGVGLDWKISNTWSLRTEYRGIIYHIPDFNLIYIGAWNHRPVPDIALVYHF